MPTPSGDQEVIDFADRVFHLEVLKGGMNRLLFRSNRSSHFPTRVEILFMNVQYLSVGTSLDGLVVHDVGLVVDDDEFAWRVGNRADLHVYELRSSSGVGHVVAGSVTVEQSDAGPSEPSRFFMMD